MKLGFKVDCRKILCLAFLIRHHYSLFDSLSVEIISLDICCIISCQIQSIDCQFLNVLSLLIRLSGWKGSEIFLDKTQDSYLYIICLVLESVFYCCLYNIYHSVLAMSLYNPRHLCFLNTSLLLILSTPSIQKNIARRIR